MKNWMNWIWAEGDARERLKSAKWMVCFHPMEGERASNNGDSSEEHAWSALWPWCCVCTRSTVSTRWMEKKILFSSTILSFKFSSPSRIVAARLFNFCNIWEKSIFVCVFKRSELEEARVRSIFRTESLLRAVLRPWRKTWWNLESTLRAPCICAGWEIGKLIEWTLNI